MGLLVCTAFVSIVGYVALVHTAVLMIFNLAIAVAVSTVQAVMLAATGGAVWALCGYGLVNLVNVGAPLGIQIVVNTLGVDILKADRDPLTGLLNRRAFYERVSRLVSGPRGGRGHLLVVMIDLDRFKALNDTRGHAVGDMALVAVGHALRAQTRQGAVVCRAGGEEFLVADVFTDPKPDLVGQRLCDVVAALPYPITASVGTASVPCDLMVQHDDPKSVITTLVGEADTAMYDAKRNGGNQTRHQPDPLDELSR